MKNIAPVLRTGLRYMLGGVFIYAGVLHFTKTPVYESVMPPYLPYHRALVLVSGACEIAGGVGVLLPFPIRRWAGWGLAALLVAVFPANVNMALHGAVIGGATLSPLLLWARLPLQAVLIAWVWWCAAFVQKPAPTRQTANPKKHLHPLHSERYNLRFFDFSEERKAISGATPGIDFTDARNKAMDQGFPKALRKMGWTLLQAGDNFDPAAYPCAIVVGVFIWDNGALKELEYLHEKTAGKAVPVFVVDIDASYEALDRLMPQIQMTFHNSPVLMEYTNGAATQWNRPATYRRISEM